MAHQIPEFAKGEGYRAVDEAHRLLDAHPEAAAWEFARLLDMNGDKRVGAAGIPAEDRIDGVERLFCRKVHDWGILYCVKPRIVFEIVVVHVARIDTEEVFRAALGEAFVRLAAT